MKSLSTLAVILFLAGCTSGEPESWYRGNLHTHTFWSDGDDFPESIIAWYRDNGYHFVSMSDHNTLADGARWMRVDSTRRHAYDRYVDLWPDRVHSRLRGDTLEVRLATFEEYAGLHNQKGAFLVIQSEEISDRFDGKPLHVNATNIKERIAPQGGTSVTDVLQRNIDAVLEQRHTHNQPMVPHVNHPNFGWAVTPDDLVPLEGEHFFEVYNGHPAVHNYGDDQRPGTEAMWDYVNTKRLADRRDLVYGLAVDDAHNYFDLRVGRANTGRGWVMVRTDSLSAAALIAALERGDFYGSSGVELARLHSDGEHIEIGIAPEDGVSYTTLFLGVLASDPDGTTQEFHRAEGSEAQYRFSGNELFVRATVISSRLMDNPFTEGEVEKAWIQPVLAR